MPWVGHTLVSREELTGRPVLDAAAQAPRPHEVPMTWTGDTWDRPSARGSAVALGCTLSEMQGRKELGHLAYGFLDPVGPHPVISIPFHLWHLCHQQF